MTIERTHKIIAFVLLLGGIAWWWFGHVTMAQSDHTEQITLVEAVEKLTTIHIRQSTIEEAREKQLKELCEAGKLIDCVDDKEED
jgi:hypothetical protein